MSGPGHYREAERQVALVDDGAADWEPLAASAQVHATLALAAATALGRFGSMPAQDSGEWLAAIRDTGTEVTR